MGKKLDPNNLDRCHLLSSALGSETMLNAFTFIVSYDKAQQHVTKKIVVQK